MTEARSLEGCLARSLEGCFNINDSTVACIRRQLFFGSRVAIEERGTQELREMRAPSGALLFDGVRRFEIGLCSAVADGRGAH